MGDVILAGFINRVRREFLGDRLPGERRMVQIDAGVDEADGHPGARLGVLALEQGEVAVGHIRLDVIQPPLVPETVSRTVHVHAFRRRLRECLWRNAVSFFDCNALRGSRTAVDVVAAAERERQKEDDETNKSLTTDHHSTPRNLVWPL